MPSPKRLSHKDTRRNCAVCGKPLVLGNTRDIERKRFCSVSCRNTHGTKTRIAAMPEKECVVCGARYKSKSINQKCCSAKCLGLGQVERSYRYMNNNVSAYILHLIAKPQRRHLHLLDLLALYERQQGVCALTGVELSFIKKMDGVKVHTNLSIDRIDSNRGYELDNIQFVCAIVNVMKSTLSVQDLKWWCARIVEGGV